MSFAECLAKIRRATQVSLWFWFVVACAPGVCLAGSSVTLAWDPSSDPSIIGYKVYYGAVTRTYTNVLDVGSLTQATLSNLVSGTTYYFAATAYNAAALESTYSTEASYAIPVPVNVPPTLDQPSDLAISEGASQQSVTLTGITSGSPTEAQSLTVAATSSNPALLPNPTIAYTSPNTTALLTFTPAPLQYGSATVSVLVDDGGVTNSSVIRSFAITVIPVNHPPTLDPIPSLTFNEGSSQVVALTGISTGATNECDTLTISAVSSRPDIVPNPTVLYSSPNPTGTLTIAPQPLAYGTAVVTVNVNDGGLSNNFVAQSFTVTVTPVNQPPTLDPLNDLNLGTNPTPQTINLSGITSGASNEFQTLVVTASSSNPALIPAPVVSYVSPNTSGTLTLTPATNGAGTATITVTVNDSAASNNIVSRTFNVVISPSTSLPPAITNSTVPDVAVRVLIPAPNADRLSYQLDPGAPTGARLVSRNILSWKPSRAYASTTNLMNVRITDLDVPTLSTVQAVVVIVSDYLEVTIGSTNVYAGQGTSVPLGVFSSAGVTNLTFSVPWSAARFSLPTLSGTSSVFSLAKVTNQTTNLLITLRTKSGQVLQNTNYAGQLNFQTAPTQSSGFVQFCATNLTGSTPSGGTYANQIGTAGQLALVSDTPLIQALAATNSVRLLTVYGRAGTNYVVQYTTNLNAPTWYPSYSYSQTSAVQVIGASSGMPQVFYRLKQ